MKTEAIDKKETWCFIDLENLPNALSYVAGRDYQRIFIFVGPLQKFSNDIAKQDNVEVIKVTGVSKNNLDFHLTYYLGKCQTNAGNHIDFEVLSGDKGWDRLIEFIQKEGRVCKRISVITGRTLNKTMEKSTPMPIVKSVPSASPNLPLPIDIQPVWNKILILNRSKKALNRWIDLINCVQSLMRVFQTTKTALQIVETLDELGFITVTENGDITYIKD